ncbi:MAG: stage III sporulation protein AA [Oscillospiraceae bacterium]|nr:stage III sporulation protein AA [Oscillospiraceae bacterium]
MEDRITRYEQAAALLPPKWQRLALHLPDHQKERVEELRLRVGQSMTVLLSEGEIWPSQEQPRPVVTQADLEQLCDIVSGYSRYASSETLAQGYLTAPGGFRVGFCGTAVLREGQRRNLRDFTSACIRVGREQQGLALPLLPKLMEGDRLCSTLILSPPGAGKTTLLRDLVRCCSDGTEAAAPHRVGLVDERGEIAGVCRGVPQLAVGCHTDVLDGCPKASGILMLLRALNPQIIAVDEITAQEDIAAIVSAAHCGVTLLSTLHAVSVEELKEKPLYATMMSSRVFSRAVVIKRCGEERTYEVKTL